MPRWIAERFLQVFVVNHGIKSKIFNFFQSPISVKILHVWMDQGASGFGTILIEILHLETHETGDQISKSDGPRVKSKFNSKWKAQLLPRNMSCETCWRFWTERPNMKGLQFTWTVL